MSGLWRVVTPTNFRVLNLCPNPSFEIDTSGWTSGGLNTLAAVNTDQYRGLKSAQVTWDDSTTLASIALTIPDAYLGHHFISARIRASSDFGVISFAITTTGTTQNSVSYNSTTGVEEEWVEISIDVNTASTNGQITVAIVCTGTPPGTTALCFIDGLLITAGGGTWGDKFIYFDGDSTQATWLQELHNSYSISTLEANRLITNLEDINTFILNQAGFGMSPVENVLKSRALLQGATLAQSRIPARNLLLSRHTKGTSLSDLHDQRKSLVDIFAPHGIGPQLPVQLQYLGNGTNQPINIDVRYDSGLDISGRQGFSDADNLLLVAPNPFFYSNQEEGEELTIKTDLFIDHIGKRDQDLWANLGDTTATTNGRIFALEIASDGTVYVGGEFTSIGGVSANRIAKYNTQTQAWEALGSGLSYSVSSLTSSPDGRVFAGLTTTNVNKVQVWNGSTWTPITGTNWTSSRVWELYWQKSTELLFIAGASTTTTVESWDGTTVSSFGGTGLNNTVFCMTEGPDGKMYFGGSMTLADGATIYKLVTWDGTSWAAVGGNDLNATSILDIEFDTRGLLYIAGNFDSTIAAHGAATWNGNTFAGMEDGLKNDLGSTGSGLKVALIGDIAVYSGYFVTAGSIAAEGVAYWNGSTWASGDIVLSDVTQQIYTAVKSNQPDPILYLATGEGATQVVAAKTIVTNSGTAIAFPKLTLTRESLGPANLVYLKNVTVDATIWLNGTIAEGESIVFDFEKKTVTSSFSGNVIGDVVLSNSEFSKFGLLPGDNEILLLIDGTAAHTTATIHWSPQYWSIDT